MSANEICETLGPREGGKDFRCVLKSGDQAIFCPLAWSKWEVPRLLSIYAILSKSVNVHRFFGVFSDETGHYTVMEDLEGPKSSFVCLQDALSYDKIAELSRTRRLRLCYEIALSVAYLHSVNIVVKVISTKSIYLREVEGELIPVLTNLEYARQVLQLFYSSADMIRVFRTQTTSPMTNDTTRQNTEMLKGKVQHIPRGRISGGNRIRDTLIKTSLGVLLWQILGSWTLPENFTAPAIAKAFGDETDPLIIHLIGGCLATRPSSRLAAFEITQQLLDEYNDVCAKIEDHEIYALVEKCRKMVHARRIDHSKVPDKALSKVEIVLLLQYVDSWDDPGSPLRLAPEASFLIGAGILWDLIDVDHVQVRPTIVSRGTVSPKGIPY